MLNNHITNIERYIADKENMTLSLKKVKGYQEVDTRIYEMRYQNMKESLINK